MAQEKRKVTDVYEWTDISLDGEVLLVEKESGQVFYILRPVNRNGVYLLASAMEFTESGKPKPVGMYTNKDTAMSDALDQLASDNDLENA